MLDKTLQIRLNLRLTHFPYALAQINPAALLSNALLRNHGQLVGLKLARVVNVFPQQVYLRSKLHMRACHCSSSPETYLEVNQNPLKIFKNQVSYSSRLGKHLYYDTVDDNNEVHCEKCQTRYTVKNQKYAPCQKAEVLALDHENSRKSVISLASNISTLWLIEPFVNSLEIGDVVNLTAYYFMCPQQQIQKATERCVSPLLGSFVAFDIVKVNPFNQMVVKDAALASLFFNNGDQSTTASSSVRETKLGFLGGRHSMLTLENIKMHDRQI